MGKEQVQPSFTKISADTFYPHTYSTPRTINLPDLHWFPPILTTPDTEGFVSFDNSPIKPRDIRKVLSKANKNSAPGPDGVSYGVLLKLEIHISESNFVPLFFFICMVWFSHHKPQNWRSYKKVLYDNQMYT